ncbi:hypothetical protein [Pseudomonas typographi]|uniref:Lipoprotein n=1 Tax=Pseudomonas typographi TaxID=2715964 RepID=A0ABR7Z838_9PSED|nr:hypothetical protein [Pseudomonas typographi]MBD1553870.1 hypothetical protein [Pseudomonas typographi]MBD1590055.1 hypothetical protein [Pseudomonas typographi]MBD1601705.1 hypothetical protein [Pseudomonas typographi]
MKALHALILGTSLLALHGCFDSADKNNTQHNNDGSQSSVQMQDKDADKK